ncbi:DUF1173 family protein [Cognatiyoonia sp. IB215182]|uniref:DUF1173 family protein n=1 Tax=Cognatiyoonia sp. IB215182 TaxID=3097353 RepID=UPI002A122600|nr:DUF1173 family protein [Cognatiyoonia sp. IB215182]MDX8355379.1 DUF1173 family protein [Cognatiyoonia sp. IB215182]
MLLYLNDCALDLSAQDAQAALEEAHKTRTRVECRCTRPPQEMYITKIGARFYVKRMPGTGPRHAPDCDAFEAPEHLSGLSELNGTAIVESADEGTTLLKLGFPLTKRRNQAAPPSASGATATEAISNPKKMSLTALLHYLWHEADLVKWVPAMEGKRWWGVVCSALRRGMDSKIAKGLSLGDVVYIPEPFSVPRAAQLTEERTRKFDQIARMSPGGTSVGILIAEYKSHQPSIYGSKFTFKHIPDCSFFADADLTKRFNRVFEEQLILASIVDGAMPIAIATFTMTKAGYPALQTIGMILVTREFLPFEHVKEAKLLETLVSQKRRFIKQQRFNLPPDATIASVLLSDTENPIAMFVTPPGASVETIRDIQTALQEEDYPHWIWGNEVVMPTIAAPGSRHVGGTPA